MEVIRVATADKVAKEAKRSKQAHHNREIRHFLQVTLAYLRDDKSQKEMTSPLVYFQDGGCGDNAIAEINQQDSDRWFQLYMASISQRPPRFRR